MWKLPVFSAGTPTPGTVRIENTNETIRHSVDASNGDVTIDGFIVQSFQESGIALYASGDVLIENVTAVFS